MSIRGVQNDRKMLKYSQNPGKKDTVMQNPKNEAGQESFFQGSLGKYRQSQTSLMPVSENDPLGNTGKKVREILSQLWSSSETDTPDDLAFAAQTNL